MHRIICSVSFVGLFNSYFSVVGFLFGQQGQTDTDVLALKSAQICIFEPYVSLLFIKKPYYYEIVIIKYLKCHLTHN